MDVNTHDKAFVTLAMDDVYAGGALVLGYSLRRVATRYKLCILITSDVSESIRKKLKCVFDEVREVDIFDSRDEANLALMDRPELGKTFTKLHVWKLTHYKKCVFLDADTLAIKNCDELFEHDELSAVPDCGWPDCFNSGVFVFIPSDDTFQKLISLAESEGSFDGGDQGLLNTFFSEWQTGRIENHLSFIYNMVTNAMYSYHPAYKRYGQRVKIVHFLGPLKPWHHDHCDDQGYYNPCDGCCHSSDYYRLWWDINNLCVKSMLPDEQEQLCKDIVHLGIQSQSPLRSPDEGPSSSRQQLWERGQIDYLGTDSFDSVQKKLDDAISTPSSKSDGKSDKK